MITITNNKVAGFDPRWAAFRGFSLLFDNPGTSPRVSGVVAYMDCDVYADADLSLYKALWEGIQHIGRDHLIQTYLFCPLPPASYHVTVWDGVNAGNAAHVAALQREACERFLNELPGSLSSLDPFPDIAAAELVSKPDWDIRFRFERLENWSSVSLVARLAPADPNSAHAMQNLTAARSRLSASFEARFGVSPNPIYAPHVTLGYFADWTLAEQANPCPEAWDAAFRQRTAGLTISMHRVSLYGFTDMATFFKADLS